MQSRPTPQIPEIAVEEIANSSENTAMKAKELFKRVMIVAELLAKSGQESPVKSTRKTSTKTQN